LRLSIKLVLALLEEDDLMFAEPAANGTGN
jgi:hypothetical protein